MFRNCITCFAFTVLTVVSRFADVGDTDGVNVAFTERTGECVQSERRGDGQIGSNSAGMCTEFLGNNIIGTRELDYEIHRPTE